MEDRSEAGPGLTIRAGDAADAPFVVALGSVAFARFGDYAPIMSAFVRSPDVAALIAWRGRDRVGFALVETLPASPDTADLVAIAVDARHRRAGLGRALLARVIAFREALRSPTRLVLTVADDNEPAIALFRSFGFEMIPGSFGSYAGGQVSRRMSKIVIPRSR